jgi:transposase InsO family protein
MKNASLDANANVSEHEKEGYFYLYLILNMFSRKIVGWESHDEESVAHATTLIRCKHLRADP